MSFEQEKLSVTKTYDGVISQKSARLLALCGDHSNYTFEQAGYKTTGCAQKNYKKHLQFLKLKWKKISC
jgi:hypothetical protein